MKQKNKFIKNKGIKLVKYEPFIIAKMYGIDDTILYFFKPNEPLYKNATWFVYCPRTKELKSFVKDPYFWPSEVDSIDDATNLILKWYYENEEDTTD